LFDGVDVFYVATIPNIKDMAMWLNVPQHATFVFGEEYRPVKIEVK
jgi:replicative superfamily II helicase